MSEPVAESSPVLVDMCVNPTAFHGHSHESGLAEMLSRAKTVANVSTVLLVGGSPEDAGEIIRLSRTFDQPFALGIHPLSPIVQELGRCCSEGTQCNTASACDLYDRAVIPFLSRLRSSSVYDMDAIGEMGLNYRRSPSAEEKIAQLKVFEQLLLVARDTKLPMFLHERDAHADFVAMLTRVFGAELGTPAVPPMLIHCFTGSELELSKYLDLGCYIGLSGFISMTNNAKHTRSAIEAAYKKDPELVLSRIVLETDAPHMRPLNIPKRLIDANSSNSSSSEPMHVLAVANAVSNLLGVPVCELAARTTQNSYRFMQYSMMRRLSAKEKK